MSPLFRASGKGKEKLANKRKCKLTYQKQSNNGIYIPKSYFISSTNLASAKIPTMYLRIKNGKKTHIRGLLHVSKSIIQMK